MCVRVCNVLTAAALLAEMVAAGDTSTDPLVALLSSSTEWFEQSEGSSTDGEVIYSESTTPVEGGEPALKRIEIFTVEFHHVETPFIIGMWIFLASIAKIGFHMTPKLSKAFPESCLLIVIGVAIGLLLFLSSSVHVSPLTPATFFIYMLPPIILDAGYFMPNRLFFDHLGTILLFAVVGTIFNTLTIGVSLWLVGLTGMFGTDTPLLEMFLFSALISAVDPVAVLAVFEEIHVNEILYIVVFGESLLNDAVTVVLYHMFASYAEMGPSNILYTDILAGFASFFVVAIGGTVIGIFWGFLTGLVTRYTYEVRVIEPIFIFVMAYLAFLNAEIFHMSGLLSITFCGITMKNYVEANISHKSHTTVKYAMKMLSSSSETIIFMFLGVATVNDSHIWNTWFVVLTIFFCSIFRALGVILLTAIANHFRLNKLSRVDEFVMSYGGLRGAVAFALVLLIDPKKVKLQPMFVTTTIAVIYFTVFFQGITIKPLVKLLNVRRAEKRKCTMNERIHERFIDHMMAGVEDIVGFHGNYHVRDKFKRFDNKFIRPLLLRNHQGAEPKILETYSKLAMKDAIDLMHRNPSSVGVMPGAESMSAIFRNFTAQNLNSSCTQLDTSNWNIDLQELEYNPSKKDMTDAKIHHLLSEELCKPRRHRRLSYSRHAVHEQDLMATQEVNYKMHMNIRKVIGERRHHHHKRSKKLNKDGKQSHVSFPEFQQNGSAKQLTNDFMEVVLQADEEEESKKEDWDGITFTARSSQSGSPGLLSQIASLPGFDPTRARLVKQYSKPFLDYDDAPTVAEVSLPWRRADTGDSAGEASSSEGNYRKRPPHKMSCRRSPHNYPHDSSDDIRDLPEDYEGVATERVLPWKRDDSDSALSTEPVRQEFPAWCSNKEYIAYNSPSATFLGGIDQPKTASVIGLFRRDSTGSVGGRQQSRANSESSLPVAGSKEPTPSIILIEEGLGVGAGSGSSNGSGSSRRPLLGRRGSMLELGSVDPIPEEEIIAGGIAVMSPHNSLPSLTDGLPGPRRANGPPTLTPFTAARRHYVLGQVLTSSDSSNNTSIDENI